MAISKDTIEQIRQAVDIVEVIDGYVPLKRAGANYKALSPFNKEKTPSFFVNPQRQTFYCYSSGQGGDVFKFLQLYEGLDFIGAVRRLADRAGIILREEQGNNEDYRKSKQEKDLLYTLHGEVAARWREFLLKDSQAEPAREYLRSRDIPLNWVKEFNLGYAPDSWDDLIRWGKEKGYSIENLVDAGLVIRNEEKRRHYDRFRGRLVFSIANDIGQVIAFSARSLDPASKEAKYINSPETKLYTKSKVLFGFDRAKRAILDVDQVILCEGQIDVLRCHSVGLKNVVAPLGTAFTEQHAQMIRRFTKNIVLCLDADQAGQRAAGRVAELILERGDRLDAMVQSDLGIQVMKLPQGHDPDSLIAEQGVEAFKQYLDQRLEYLDFLMDHLVNQENIETLEGKRKVIEAVVSFLFKIPNTIYREQLIGKAAVRLQVSQEVLREEILKLKKSGSKTRNASYEPEDESQKVQVVSAEPLKVHPMIKELIFLVIGNQDLVPELQKGVKEEWIQHLEGSSFLYKLVELYNNEEWTTPASLFDHLDDQEQNWVAGLKTEVLEGLDIGVLRSSLEKLCQKLHLNWINHSLTLVNQEMRQQGNVSEQEEKLRRKQFDLIQLKKSLTGGN